MSSKMHLSTENVKISILAVRPVSFIHLGGRIPELWASENKASPVWLYNVIMHPTTQTKKSITLPKIGINFQFFVRN